MRQIIVASIGTAAITAIAIKINRFRTDPNSTVRPTGKIGTASSSVAFANGFISWWRVCILFV
jgi:hypothetical protein